MQARPNLRDDPLEDFEQERHKCREAILEAVSFAAEHFLKTAPWHASIPGILEKLGKATGVSDVRIFQNDHSRNTTLPTRQLYEWTAPHVANEVDSPSSRISLLQVVRTPSWMDAMKQGLPVYGLTKDFPAGEKDMLLGQGIKSIVTVPILVEGKWWGFIEFDDRLTERNWSAAEADALKTAANIIGAAIQHEYSENRVLENEQRYKELADFLPQPVFEIDPNGNLIFANRSAFEYFGYTEEDFRKGLNALDMFRTEDRKRVSEAIQERLTGDSSGSVEFYARTKDGDVFPVLVQAAPIYRTGKPVGLRGILVDITERKQMEEMLRKSEQLYRKIFNHSPLGIMHFDQNGIVVDCNRKFLQIVGSQREAVIGFRMRECLQDEKMKSALQDALSGKIGHFEGDYLSVTGKKPTSIGIIFSQILSEKGEFLCGLCIAEDISERKRAEQALRQSEARYRAIVEDQTELISRFAPDGTLTFVNDAYCRYFGETENELIGHKFWHHVPPDDQEKFKKHLAKLNPQNQVASIEHRVYTSTGEVRWQQWTDRAVCDDQGNIIEFQAVGRDITERRKAEEALRESEEQMRYLSSQILKAQENERQRIARDLHDSIIQSLATIKINLRVNLKRLNWDGAGKDRESFESIISMIQNTIEEVRRVYTDLRPSMLDNLGILATMSWACQEFQDIHRGIRIQTQTDIKEDEISETLKIVIYRIMQEALNNIAKHSKANLVDISLKKDDGKIHLTIEDNGCGFNVAAMFSGHNDRHGLGLVSMKERTELSGGTFVIESADQCGTTIRSSWQCSHLENG